MDSGQAPDLNPVTMPMKLVVCGDKACGGGESERLYAALELEASKRGLLPRVTVSRGLCRGLCSMSPTLVIQPLGILYCKVKVEDVPTIFDETVIGGRVVKYLQYQEPQEIAVLPQFKDVAFSAKQIRIALHNCGIINPDSIDEYIARDGYRGLGKVLTEMSPEDVIKEVKESGLRGRGGAGFLTGQKWEFCRRSPGTVKYVICNADEGDPGAFMDRSILESDPHSVIEGMAVAGYAIGARQGYIYCREEYPLAIARLQRAIEQAHEYGLLGENILGTTFSFDIELKGGAGAFVCGEETALIASIEGRRGEPRPRPPFPAVSGLWGKPSNINNVKSYAMTPQIILKGAKWFASIGSPKSPGTAVFALTGKVANTGLIEVPMGIPLGDIIFDVGGGVPKGKQFKAVQTGGPLGGCLPASCLNTPVDFDSLQEAGAVMGSGGMIVVDDDTCMVELAKYFLTFAAAESCGKCVPCRIGGQRLLEALERITTGKGSRADLKVIRQVSEHMMSSSLCGLGQRTPGPIMAALRFFEEEFREHIDEKMCRAGQCKPLVRAKCINTCPAGVDTPAYLALVAQGRYEEGLKVHRERNPFAMICGRACPAFCESKCRRGEIDDPVAVRQVKRFMADEAGKHPWIPEPIGTPAQRAENARKKIAVIGSGPAGLTAAVRLAQRGYKVTVFEKLGAPGGMLSWAIPEYRLPRDILFFEIDNIRRAGVEIQCNKALGRDFTIDSLMKEGGYSAVVLAIGAHKSRQMGVPGEDKKGVINGIDFLREVATENTMKAVGQKARGNVPDLKGKSVGVIGGGDVAIDAARVALRLGAKEVHVMYRRTGDDMPATHLPEEIEGALHEGVRFHTLVAPVEILGQDHVTGIRLQRQRLGEFDNSARRKPISIEVENYTVNVDYVIPAIGQTPDLSWVKHAQVEATRGQTFAVNEAFATNRPGVFAAGDAVTGAATIVQAIAQGNLVAVSVDHWLTTGKLEKPVYETPRHDVEACQDFARYAEARRAPVPRIPVQDREGNFREVEIGYDEKTAREEANRCLRCDLEWLEMMGLEKPVAAAEK